MNKKVTYDIKLDKVPKHIAIIMDGNGRWAKSKFLPRNSGHKAGVESIKEVTEEAAKLGVKHLTLYAFSTENWKRPKLEIDGLMLLLSSYLKNGTEELHKNNVKITVIGDINPMPKDCVEEIKKACELTKNNTGINLNIALNYGSRQDIKHAVVELSKDIKAGRINPEEINEEIIINYLSTKSIPDPDLIIRTSGEQRLSNFLLWEAAYSEFYFTEVNWPDFGKLELQKAIYTYQNRNRRFGGLK